MCPDPRCTCIQGGIAIWGCVRNIDQDKANLIEADDYLEDNMPNFDRVIEQVQNLCERGDASEEQKDWLKAALRAKRKLDKCRGSKTRYCRSCGIGAEVIARRKLVERLLGDEPLKKSRQLAVPLPKVEMIGMDSKFQEFWRIFDDESTPLIGIHGMPGTGKSAFLMNVNNEFNDPVNRRGFEKVIWVASSSTRDIEGLQSTIADRLGLESPPNVTRELRAGAIHRELEGINFVLLLDNISDDLELSDIGVPYSPSDNEKKRKIVFTAQRIGILSNLDPEPLDLGLLDKESATLLFNSKVGKVTPNADQADHIVHMCSGLPVALVKIGNHLRIHNTRSDWDKTVDNLKFPEIAELGGPEESIYECLISAYRSLRPSATQVESLEQKCFLYCCLFPGGHPIDEEELKRHWVAEDFLGNDYPLHHRLERGDSILDTLKRAHLLTSTSGQPVVEMHPQIYNLGRWISSGHSPNDSQSNFYVRSSSYAELEELPMDHGWAQVERMSLVDTTIAGLKGIGCSRLSTLILKNCTIISISSDFFEAMKTLKVLNLSESSLPDILSGVHGLTCLQYLNLSRSNIQMLTEDFKHLKKLIGLDLSFTPELKKIAAGVLSNLPALQWLNMYYCGVGRQAERGSSSSPEELMALLNEVLGLKSLQDLGITVRSIPALTKLQESGHLNNTHSLLITDSDATLLPKSASAAKELKTNRKAIAHAGSLKALHIVRCRAFPEFQEISIRVESCFPKLRDVKIKDCGELAHLTWLMHAEALESLEIVGCKSLTRLISGDRGSHGTAAGQPNQLPFSNLKNLRLEGLSSLLRICFQDLPFHGLEKITVLSCPQLSGISIDVGIARQQRIPIHCQKSWWDRKLNGETQLKLHPSFQ